MADLLTIDVEGMPELTTVLSLVAEAFDEWQLLWEAFIRPTRGPGGKPIIPAEYTLEGSVRAAFASGGRSKYSSSPWADYSNEPVYAQMKLEQGGGTRILIWDGSRRPLVDTFLNKGDSDHIEEVTKQGFVWGSSRPYAQRLHEGGFFQPWDDIEPPARPIIRLTSEAGVQLGKGVQRLVAEKIRRGGVPEAFTALRAFP